MTKEKISGKALAKFFVRFYNDEILGYRLGQAFCNHFSIKADDFLYNETDDKVAVGLLEKYLK